MDNEVASTCTTAVMIKSFLAIADEIKKLNGRPLILEVYVFGSVARHGKGNDLDLIIVASEQVYMKFHYAYNHSIKIMESNAGDTQEVRKRALCKAVIISLEGSAQILLETLANNTGYQLDVQMFPSYWREQPEQVDYHSVLPRGFTAQLIKSAVRVA